MLDKKMFVGLKKDYGYFNKNRREIIGWSSDALNKSKIAIFTMHKGDISAAAELLKQVEKTLNALEPVFKKSPALRYEGSYKAALEEYAEAKLLYKIMAENKLSLIKEVKIDFDSYLAGLCDTTGELVRVAVKEATAGNVKRVEELKETITDIMGELVEFNLTSYLRTKYDQAKMNLRKIEQINYEMKVLRRN